MEKSPLYDFDLNYLKKYKIIAGVDEVGRGPIAGPVVCAAVILKWPNNINLLTDSKGLSLKKRLEYFNIIKENALDIKISVIENDVIDRINILNATKLAMKDAIEKLSIKPNFILIDYIPEPFDIKYEYETIKKGDIKSLSISCASIIAKVYRDNLMIEYSKKYPGYDFDKNMGYPTKVHYESIKKLGIVKIHRKTFKGVIIDK